MYFDDENRNNEMEPEKVMKQFEKNEGILEKSRPLSEDAAAFDEFIKGKNGYVISTTLSQDDDMETELNFLFLDPKAASYDRYAKTASSSSSKAMKAFCLDNIHPEQRRDLDDKLSKWPALGISLGEKLLYMLGLSKTTRVRKL